MVRRRFVDPTQKSIFDIIAVPEPLSKAADEPQPLPEPPSPAPDPPAPPTVKYSVYRPRRWLWSSVIGTLVLAFKIVPQPQDPTVSYQFGVALIGVILAIVLVVPFMFIPWPKGRRAFRNFDTKRAAGTVQVLFFVAPLVVAAALGFVVHEIAAKDIIRTYQDTRAKWEDEAVRREWEKKTETVPAPIESPPQQ